MAKIFPNELNLNGPNKSTSHTNGIHTHTATINALWGWPVQNPKHTLPQHKRSSTVVRCRNQLARVPKQHFVLQNGPQRQTDIRTNWQKCPNSSQCSQTVLNGGQNQLARIPNSTSANRWEGCLCAHQWIYLVLELISSSQMQVSIPPKNSISWQPVPSRGETGRILKTNGFGSS